MHRPIVDYMLLRVPSTDHILLENLVRDWINKRFEPFGPLVFTGISIIQPMVMYAPVDPTGNTGLDPERVREAVECLKKGGQIEEAFRALIKQVG